MSTKRVGCAAPESGWTPRAPWPGAWVESGAAEQEDQGDPAPPGRQSGHPGGHRPPDPQRLPPDPVPPNPGAARDRLPSGCSQRQRDPRATTDGREAGCVLGQPNHHQAADSPRECRLLTPHSGKAKNGLETGPAVLPTARSTAAAYEPGDYARGVSGWPSVGGLGNTSSRNHGWTPLHSVSVAGRPIRCIRVGLSAFLAPA